jgi:hypothetical protein
MFFSIAEYDAIADAVKPEIITAAEKVKVSLNTVNLHKEETKKLNADKLDVAKKALEKLEKELEKDEKALAQSL